MILRSTLRNRVNLKTARESETNFADLVNDAFNEFLLESALAHTFREMKDTITIAYAVGNQARNLPSGTLTGFSSSVHQVLTARSKETTNDRFTSSLKIRSQRWLELHFPDRTRASAIKTRMSVAARFKDTMELSAPVSVATTMLLTVSYLPADWNDTVDLVFPNLASALVAYGTATVYESIEQFADADRFFAKARGLRSLAIADDEKDPAQTFKADARPFSHELYNCQDIFDLSNLQDTYPGDVL